MEEVFDARIHEGLTASAKDRNSVFFRAKDSEAALDTTVSRMIILEASGAYLNNHIHIPKTLDAVSIRIYNGDSLTSLLCVNFLNLALRDIFCQKCVHKLEGCSHLVFGPPRKQSAPFEHSAGMTQTYPAVERGPWRGEQRHMQFQGLSEISSVLPTNAAKTNILTHLSSTEDS